MIVFDGHNDTLTRADMEIRSFLEGTENATGHLDLPRAKRGGLGGGMFAIFTPAPPELAGTRQHVRRHLHGARLRRQ